MRYFDLDIDCRLASLDLAFDQLIVRTPVGLDQHVIDVVGEYVAFFRDACSRLPWHKFRVRRRLP